jgi:cytochrome c556
MPPMPDALWTSKELDKEENIEEALAIIQQAVDVFKHLLKPEVQGDMRTTHNKVWTEFDVFQDAIVALRAKNQEAAPEFNIAKLWQEYSELVFLLLSFLPLPFFLKRGVF